MILGLDVSTSITGATILDSSGKVVHNTAWDTRKFKNFFIFFDFLKMILKARNGIFRRIKPL